MGFVCWHVQNFFSYLGDELKGALSDLLPVLLCSPSFLFLFGRRAQRRPFGLIASTLIFSIFLFASLFSFAHIMNTHIHWYSFIPMDIPICLYLKSPFPYFKRHSLVSKMAFRYNPSFHLFNFSKHPFLISSLINYGVSSNFSRSS